MRPSLQALCWMVHQERMSDAFAAQRALYPMWAEYRYPPPYSNSCMPLPREERGV